MLLYTLIILKEVFQTIPNEAKKALQMKTVLFDVLNLRTIESNSKVEIQQLKEAIETLYKDIVNKPMLLLQGTQHNRLPPNNFRQLPIFPTDEEILTHERPYLRANIVKGSYESVDHYLDVQYRLLREDYIDPLRRGIMALQNPDIRDHRRLEVKVYENVKIFAPELNIRSGVLIYKLKFDVSRLKHVHWEISKRFLHGSLICLSMDNFKSLCFATIFDHKPEDLKKGQLSVILEYGHLNYKDSYCMVESSAYFEAYRHVLQALLGIRDEGDMPFVKYLVKCDPKVDAPLYLRRGLGTELNLSCFVNANPDKMVKRRNMFCNVLRPSSWPTKEKLGLDQSQYNAIKLALTKELAIIQGPPGTGKTFIGYKIAQVLLQNEQCWQNKYDTAPILVVCYTNHALDQFLEDFLMCVKFKLQQESYRFQLSDNKLLLFKASKGEDILNRLLKENRYDDDLVFCLIIVPSKRIAVDLQDQLNSIDVPFIFVLNFEDADAFEAAKEIINKTTDNSKTASENR